MRLLHFTGPDQLDEVLVVVPDNHDLEKAAEEASNHIDEPVFSGEYYVLSIGPCKIDLYRPFVG